MLSVCSGSTQAGVAARGFTRHRWKPAIPETVHRIPGPAGAAAQQIIHTATHTHTQRQTYRLTQIHTWTHLETSLVRPGPAWPGPARLGVNWLLSSSLKCSSGWDLKNTSWCFLKTLLTASLQIFERSDFSELSLTGEKWVLFFFNHDFSLNCRLLSFFPAKCVFSDLCTSLLHS